MEYMFQDNEYTENLENILREYIVRNVGMMMRNVDLKAFLERNQPLEQTVFRPLAIVDASEVVSPKTTSSENAIRNMVLIVTRDTYD